MQNCSGITYDGTLKSFTVRSGTTLVGQDADQSWMGLQRRSAVFGKTGTADGHEEASWLKSDCTPPTDSNVSFTAC